MPCLVTKQAKQAPFFLTLEHSKKIIHGNKDESTFQEFSKELDGILDVDMIYLV